MDMEGPAPGLAPAAPAVKLLLSMLPTLTATESKRLKTSHGLEFKLAWVQVRNDDQF